MSLRTGKGKICQKQMNSSSLWINKLGPQQPLLSLTLNFSSYLDFALQLYKMLSLLQRLLYNYGRVQEQVFQILLFSNWFFLFFNMNLSLSLSLCLSLSALCVWLTLVLPRYLYMCACVRTHECTCTCVHWEVSLGCLLLSLSVRYFETRRWRSCLPKSVSARFSKRHCLKKWR